MVMLRLLRSNSFRRPAAGVGFGALIALKPSPTVLGSSGVEGERASDHQLSSRDGYTYPFPRRKPVGPSVPAAGHLEADRPERGIDLLRGPTTSWVGDQGHHGQCRARPVLGPRRQPQLAPSRRLSTLRCAFPSSKEESMDGHTQPRQDSSSIWVALGWSSSALWTALGRRTRNAFSHLPLLTYFSNAPRRRLQSLE